MNKLSKQLINIAKLVEAMNQPNNSLEQMKKEVAKKVIKELPQYYEKLIMGIETTISNILKTKIKIRSTELNIENINIETNIKNTEMNISALSEVGSGFITDLTKYGNFDIITAQDWRKLFDVFFENLDDSNLIELKNKLEQLKNKLEQLKNKLEINQQKFNTHAKELQQQNSNN